MEISSLNLWLPLIQIIYDGAGQNLGYHKGFFDARIHASHSLDMDLKNASKSASQVFRELKANFLTEMDWLLWRFSSMNGIAIISFLAITIRPDRRFMYRIP